jgi:hypothetical protein
MTHVCLASNEQKVGQQQSLMPAAERWRRTLRMKRRLDQTPLPIRRKHSCGRSLEGRLSLCTPGHTARGDLDLFRSSSTNTRGVHSRPGSHTACTHLLRTTRTNPLVRSRRRPGAPYTTAVCMPSSLNRFLTRERKKEKCSDGALVRFLRAALCSAFGGLGHVAQRFVSPHSHPCPLVAAAVPPRARCLCRRACSSCLRTSHRRQPERA